MMGVCLKDSKAYFLHIPKTGGTWIYKALHTCQIPLLWKVRHGVSFDSRFKFYKKHTPLQYFDPNILETINFAFCFVRHPVAFYSSIWRAMYFGGRTRRNHMLKGTRWNPLLSAVKNFIPDFNKWVEAMLENEPGWATRLFEWYVGPAEIPYCDFIGRTENLLDDFKSVLIRLGYQEQVETHEEALDMLRPIHVARLADVEWKADIKQKVLRMEKPTIDRFYSEQCYA